MVVQGKTYVPVYFLKYIIFPNYLFQILFSKLFFPKRKPEI